jgi:multisubunit Na+/H+ antiporter MnhB subunit
MTLDDSTRRQLRFSLFLQGAALFMFAVALIAQIATGGAPALIVVFGVGVVLVALATAFTVRRLRSPR